MVFRWPIDGLPIKNGGSFHGSSSMLNGSDLRGCRWVLSPFGVSAAGQRAWRRIHGGMLSVVGATGKGSHRFFRCQPLGKVGFTGLYGKIHGKYGLISKWLNFMIMQYLLRVLVRISSLDYMGIDGLLITKILGTTINGGV